MDSLLFIIRKGFIIMRVGIYIRVSTKMQEGNYSLNAQTYELTKYAKSQGWEIVDLYKDADSGTKIKKDGLASMLDDVEEGKIDVVLCIEQDRLSRLDTIKWEYLKSVLRDNKVKIAEPGNIVDLSDLEDEFRSDLKNLLAQRDRKGMLRKMARGIRQRTREGKVWGPQPAEYIYDKNTETLTINEDRAWIIPFIDDLYLNKKMSPTAISKELNKRCKTPNGKEWRESQIHQKLIHKSYHGVFEKRFANEVISNENIYPKLRSEETYNLIQLELIRRYNWKPAEPHMLRGIEMTCASCNNPLVIDKSTVPGRSEGQEYYTYSVAHSNKKIKSQCSSKPYVNVKRIVHNLKETVQGILTDPEKAKKYIDSGFDEDEVSKLNHDIKKLEKQEQNLQEKADLLLDLYLEKRWDKETLDKRRDLLDTQRSAIEKDLISFKLKRDLIQKNQINHDSVLEFLTVAKRFEDLLSVEDQQELLSSLFPSATLDIEKEMLLLHAYLPQGVTVDIKINIETMEDVKERETIEASRDRYNAAQKYLNKHRGITMKDLSLAVGNQPATLKLDQERFGKFKHIAPHWSCPKLRQDRVKAIEKALATDPQMSLRKLAEITGIYRKMISKLIAEEGLRL